MMAQKALTNLILLLLCVAPAFSDLIAFNSAESDNCLPTELSPYGCDFTNATIWTGGKVPTWNDTVDITGVVVNGTGPFPALFVPVAGLVNITNLNINTATLIVRENATVVVSNIANLTANGALQTDSLASFSASAYVDSPTASLNINGPFNVNDVTVYGAVTVQLSGVLNVVKFTVGTSNYTSNGVFQGVLNTLTVLPSVNIAFAVVTADTLIASENSTVTISSATIGHITVAATSVVTVTFISAIGTNPSTHNVSASPFSGNGTVNLQGSQAIVTAPTGAAAFAGIVNIDSVGVKLTQASFANLSTSVNSVVTVDAVTLKGETVALGNWTVINGGLTAAADLVLHGNFTVSNATLTIEKTLYTFDFFPLTFQAAIVVLGGSVIGNLTIPVNSILQINTDNATIFGNLNSNGILQASDDHTLSVYSGNVNLGHDGEVQATLSTSDDSILVVHEGLLFVDGRLSYKLAKKPFFKKMRWVIAESVNGTRNGTFINETAPALEGSKVTRNLKIEYDETKIDILFDYKISDVDWWMWVVLSVGAVVVILVIAGIIVKLRSRRANYQPVR